jgi:hypothetical protein
MASDYREKMLGKLERDFSKLANEKALVEKYIDAFETLGLAFHIVSADKDPFLTVEAAEFDDIAKIVEAMKPNGENFTLTFAGSKQIDTVSPFSIEVCNYKHTAFGSKQDATIRYASDLPVWIKADAKWMPTKKEMKEVRESCGNRNETTSYPQYYVNVGKVQTYGGSDLNSFKSYAETGTDAMAIYDALGVTAIMQNLVAEKQSSVFGNEAEETEEVVITVKP